MAHTKTDKDYEIGYGKPPVCGQFKKGTSGNPCGRPKREKNIAALLENALFGTVAVREDGRTRRLPVLTVIMKRIVNGAMQGDRHMTKLLLDLTERMGILRTDGPDGPQTHGVLVVPAEVPLEDWDEYVAKQLGHPL